MFAGWAELLDDTEPMDTSDTQWYWFYQAECGNWHRIEDHPSNHISSSELEAFYLQNPNRILTLSTQGGGIRIDFHDSYKGCMITNQRTGQMQKIKRSSFAHCSIGCKCADLPPTVNSYWEHMDGNLPYKICELSWQAIEYKRVVKFVQEIGLLKNTIRRIHRIQNSDLWELYCRKEKQLMRISGKTDIRKEWLFHGTGKNNVHHICLYNFDCRIAESRKHGHIYGKGTYFAKHASYADKYSKTQQSLFNNTRIMFLARVIVGDCTTGRPDLCKPDGDRIENIHHSCVDNTLCPRIFVVFNSDQIYPEYLLEYDG